MIIETLKNRFESNMLRHAGFRWAEVESRLLANPEALAALEWMDETGGEPDVTGRNGEKFVFADCSAESPSGRRSLCYDDAALKARKKNPPAGCADDQAQKHGIALMTEEQYRHLQTLGEFDLKTSSWILTPESIRSLGGALFCERRYGTVFVFHNGADSYYSVRGWRGTIEV